MTGHEPELIDTPARQCILALDHGASDEPYAAMLQEEKILTTPTSWRVARRIVAVAPYRVRYKRSLSCGRQPRDQRALLVDGKAVQLQTKAVKCLIGCFLLVSSESLPCLGSYSTQSPRSALLATGHPHHHKYRPCHAPHRPSSSGTNAPLPRKTIYPIPLINTSTYQASPPWPNW